MQSGGWDAERRMGCRAKDGVQSEGWDVESGKVRNDEANR
jgi:hypothetical protein